MSNQDINLIRWAMDISKTLNAEEAATELEALLSGQLADRHNSGRWLVESMNAQDVIEFIRDGLLVQRSAYQEMTDSLI